MASCLFRGFLPTLFSQLLHPSAVHIISPGRLVLNQVIGVKTPLEVMWSKDKWVASISFLCEIGKRRSIRCNLDTVAVQPASTTHPKNYTSQKVLCHFIVASCVRPEIPYSGCVALSVTPRHFFFSKITPL